MISANESPTVASLIGKNRELRQLVSDLAAHSLGMVDGKYIGHLSTRVNVALGLG